MKNTIALSKVTDMGEGSRKEVYSIVILRAEHGSAGSHHWKVSKADGICQPKVHIVAGSSKHGEIRHAYEEEQDAPAAAKRPPSSHETGCTGLKRCRRATAIRLVMTKTASSPQVRARGVPRM